MAEFEKMTYFKKVGRKWIAYKVIKVYPIYQFKDGSYELMLFVENGTVLRIYSEYLKDMQQKNFKKKHKYYACK